MSQSVRRCGGKCVTGPDAGAFIASVSFIVVPSALCLAFDVRFLMTVLSLPVGVALAVSYTWLNVCTLGALLRTTYTDPGIVPRGQPPRTPFEPDAVAQPLRTRETLIAGVPINVKWCDTCVSGRPCRRVRTRVLTCRAAAHLAAPSRSALVGTSQTVFFAPLTLCCPCQPHV